MVYMLSQNYYLGILDHTVKVLSHIARYIQKLQPSYNVAY